MTQPPLPAESMNKHLGHLDALRGIAILSVMLVHCSIITHQIGPLFAIGFTGQRGVQLFYMISAYTLCLSLDGPRQEKHPVSNYFIRRFFRIAPLFYAVILINLLLNYVAPTYSSLHDLKRSDILLGFLFLNGTRPRAINSVVTGGWSIAVETTFYLMLPLLHRYFNSVRRTLLLFALTAPVLGGISKLLAHDAAAANEQFFSFLWFPVEFPVFVLGMLSYYVWKEHSAGTEMEPRQRKQVSLLLILGSLMLYGSNLPFNDARLYFSSFLFLPLILGLSLHSWPVLVNGFTRFIGKISYSLYLIHFFVTSFLVSILTRLDQYPSHFVSNHIFHRAPGMALCFLVTLGLSTPICILSWKFLEQPGIRFGRRLIQLREGGGSGTLSPLVPLLGNLTAIESTRDSQF